MRGREAASVGKSFRNNYEYKRRLFARASPMHKRKVEMETLLRTSANSHGEKISSNAMSLIRQTSSTHRIERMKGNSLLSTVL
ncbi:hypothetical protein ANCCAN_29178 [Ancylostoma caninum]|uniref:Uncharacterized protein n=1 Tax=Ancylostoma caninum TaxID=29170 RepID=A0A368EZ55_ANCCA|nr:hypothetical protein ANCCAN_29178 [Ancylostoma caninum]